MTLDVCMSFGVLPSFAQSAGAVCQPHGSTGLGMPSCLVWSALQTLSVARNAP